jgi:hypothetical protein
MEPNFKLMLDEMKSMKTSLEGSIAVVNMSLGNRIIAVEETIFDRLEDATKVFDEWKPTVDACVKELRSEISVIHKSEEVVEKMREEMTALRKTVSRAELDATPVVASGVLPPPLVTAARALFSAGPKVTGPFVGHNVAHHHWGFGSKTPLPVKGTNPQLHPLPIPPFLLRKSFSSSMLDVGVPTSVMGIGTPRDVSDPPWDPHPSNDKLPKMNFPKFDGKNPHMWISNCNDYFETYDVAPRRWIKVSTMHLSGATAHWFPAIEQQVLTMSWPQFTTLVLERFGKDQHELLICQLFHIKQTGTVQEYADKFTSLVDGLIAYGKNTDPIYYAMKFVDGLRNDIRTVVHMHCPSTLDTAVVLVLLQEEMLDPSRKESHRPEAFQWSKPLPQAP